MTSSSREPPASAPVPHPTVHALRGATAAALCLVLSEILHLRHANLAVWTAHMAMAQYTYSAFQKGFERAVGRGLGIFLGWLLVPFLQITPLLGLTLQALLMWPIFYVHLSGRLAYTFLNAGLYIGVIVMIGTANPEAAGPEGLAMFVAVAFGVLIADLVNWFSGAEEDLTIQAGGSPLWPLRSDWANHALMLVATVLLTQLAARWLALPTEQAIVSVMMITIAPDVHAALSKGELRLLGAAAATAASLPTFLLINRLPHFGLLVALLFLWTFIASYWTRVGGASSYAGLQMGLVVPLILVVPRSEFGDLAGAVQRMEGIGIALAATVLVGGLWPFFPQGTGTPSRSA